MPTWQVSVGPHGKYVRHLKRRGNVSMMGKKEKAIATQRFPLMHMHYQEIDGKRVVETIVVMGPSGFENMNIRKLPDGTIQITTKPEKSNFFKDAKERIILNLAPELLQEIQNVAGQGHSENIEIGSPISKK